MQKDKGKKRERERKRARSSGKQMPMKAAHPANVTQAYHYQQGRIFSTIATYPRFYVPARICIYICIYILCGVDREGRERARCPPARC